LPSRQTSVQKMDPATPAALMGLHETLSSMV
jgi:hypothetical protein